MALQKIRRYSNAGSMVCNINPLLLQEEDAELLLNVTTESLGTWKKRPGTKPHRKDPYACPTTLLIYHGRPINNG